MCNPLTGTKVEEMRRQHLENKVNTALLPHDVRFPQVLAQLVDQRYKRNRAALAAAANVSPSAISQYVRGRAVPSLSVLVALARALEVSLDYLVYGDDRPADDQAAWAVHLDDTVRRMAAEAVSVRQLVDRIGLELSGQMHEVAQSIVATSGAAGGALTPAEVGQVERYASATKIASVDLELDVVVPEDADSDSVAAPGPFAHIVAANLLAGNDYDYVVPDDSRWIRLIRLLSIESNRIVEAKSADAKAGVKRGSLNIFVTKTRLVPGFILYTLDRDRMQREKPLLFDLVEGFLGATELDGQKEVSTLALVGRPNAGFNMFPLVARENLTMLVAGYHELRNSSVRLSF